MYLCFKLEHPNQKMLSSTNDYSLRPKKSVIFNFQTSCLTIRRKACLVSTQKLFTPLHRMFRHMHRTLNVDKKTNCTVCMETVRQIF
jgi:hypothetical protein